MPQTNIPAIWCEIFSKAVQDVVDSLGVELEAYPGGDRHCIFIAPVSLSRSNESIKDMINFAGFDYTRAWQLPDHEFELQTVMGVKMSWFNQQFFLKPQRHPNLIKIIEDIYSPCHFLRKIRFNRNRITFYTDIIKTYDALSDYLNDVIASGIYFNHMSPADCINRLQKIFSALGIIGGYDATDTLGRYRVKEYNWLEYLDLIYREDPRVVEKIKELIDRIRDT